MALMTGLEWRRNAVGDLIAPVEDKVFFRIEQARSGGHNLWLIRRSDHLLGSLRNLLGRFDSEEEAQITAEDTQEEL